MRRTLVLFSSVLGPVIVLAACQGGLTGADPRFSTPERTVETLFTSYGIDAMSQEQVRERLAAHGRFELRDRETFERCFSDLDGSPASEGLAGWVLGALAAGKDELRTEIVAGRATVSPREGVRIVLTEDEPGAWRIVLAQSVPGDVQRGLASLAERHDRRARESGIVR